MIENTPILWSIIGLALIGLELLTFTFILLFFGFAALIVALAKYLGVSHLALEIAIFGVTGLASLLFFRRKLLLSFKTKHEDFSDKNTKVLLEEDLAPHSQVLIQYQGSQWTAFNDSDEWIKKGNFATIVRTEGIKLILKPHFHTSKIH